MPDRAALLLSRGRGAVLGVAVLLSACASVPAPKAEFGQADLAFRKAEQGDGAHYAPLDMRIAREKLEGSREAMSDGDNLRARRLAEQAEIDALVAETKAQTARREQAAQEIRKDIEALRAEAERASRRIP